MMIGGGPRSPPPLPAAATITGRTTTEARREVHLEAYRGPEAVEIVGTWAQITVWIIETKSLVGYSIECTGWNGASPSGGTATGCDCLSAHGEDFIVRGRCKVTPTAAAMSSSPIGMQRTSKPIQIAFASRGPRARRPKNNCSSADYLDCGPTDCPASNKIRNFAHIADARSFRYDPSLTRRSASRHKDGPYETNTSNRVHHVLWNASARSMQTPQKQD